MGPFIIIPEPSVTDLARSGFSVDKSAMAEHYTALLAGKRFNEVHDLLETHGLTYNIKDERRLVFSPRYEFTGLPASYSCTVEVSFEDGRFEQVLDIYNCGVLAL